MSLDLLAMLGAGGDIATFAVLYLLWRHDRRIVRLEVHNFGAAGVRE